MKTSNEIKEELLRVYLEHETIILKAYNHYKIVIGEYQKRFGYCPLPDLTGLWFSVCRLKDSIDFVLSRPADELETDSIDDKLFDGNLSIHKLLCALMEGAFKPAELGKFGYFDSFVKLESLVNIYISSKISESRDIYNRIPNNTNYQHINLN